MSTVSVVDTDSFIRFSMNRCRELCAYDLSHLCGAEPVPLDSLSLEERIRLLMRLEPSTRLRNDTSAWDY